MGFTNVKSGPESFRQRLSPPVPDSGLEFRVQGFGVQVRGLIKGSGFKARLKGLGFEVLVLRFVGHFRVEGGRFRI